MKRKLQYLLLLPLITMTFFLHSASYFYFILIISLRNQGLKFTPLSRQVVGRPCYYLNSFNYLGLYATGLLYFFTPLIVQLNEQGLLSSQVQTCQGLQELSYLREVYFRQLLKLFFDSGWRVWDLKVTPHKPVFCNFLWFGTYTLLKQRFIQNFSLTTRSFSKFPYNLTLLTSPQGYFFGETDFWHFYQFLGRLWHLQELFYRVVRLLGLLQKDLVSFSVARVIVDSLKLVFLAISFVELRISDYLTSSKTSWLKAYSCFLASSAIYSSYSSK